MATIATFTIAGQHTVDLQVISDKYFLNYGAEEEIFTNHDRAIETFIHAARHAMMCAGWFDDTEEF